MFVSNAQHNRLYLMIEVVLVIQVADSRVERPGFESQI